MRDDGDVPNAFEAALMIEVRLHISPKDVVAVAIWRRALLNKLKEGSVKLTLYRNKCTYSTVYTSINDPLEIRTINKTRWVYLKIIY